MGFDQTTVAQNFAGPGQDTRQWVSYGLVNEDTADQHSVRFKDDEGNDFPVGPLVTVTLQPSNIECICRVAGFIAGVGEGTWFPIQQKDEVIVLIPEGDERAAPVIIGRLNNGLDSWPTIVGGSDQTKNTTGFWRLRTPFIIETGESFLIRSAKTNAQIGIDPSGNVLMNSGELHSMVIGETVMGFLSQDQSTSMQLKTDKKQVYMVADSATFLLDASESKFLTQGSLILQTAVGLGHAITVEQAILLMMNFVSMLGPFFTVPPPIFASASAFDAQVSALLAGIATGAPAALPAPTPYGTTVTFPLTFNLGIPLALSSPLASIDVTGFFPGIGRGNFQY